MLFEDLHEVLSQRPETIALVVGAGVTLGALGGTPAAKTATWLGLLEDGLHRCKEMPGWRSEDTARVQKLLASDLADDWISAAQLVTRGLGGPTGGEFSRWLAETTGTFAKVAQETETLRAIRALAERGALVITVNYDSVLEQAAGLPTVTWRQPNKIDRLLRGVEPGVLHLHGHWDDPESVVLGTQTYDEVSADAHTQAVMRALRTMKTFVLLGHGAGLRDPNWGPFLRWTAEVFARSEGRHFRLALDREVEAVQAEHPLQQRIFVLSYGAAYGDLGPFLTKMLPTSVTISTDTVVMLVNLGERDHDFVSIEQARAIVGDPVARCIEFTADMTGHFDRETASPRTWRKIARGLDQLVDETKKAIGSGTRVVLVARAPLPVFAYLGVRMWRRRVLVANDLGNSWELFGPPDVCPPGGRKDFKTKKPQIGRHATGPLALSVRSSREYEYDQPSVDCMVAIERVKLEGCYEIYNSKSWREFPLTNAELPVVLRQVDDMLAWRRKHAANTRGMILAFAGVNWLAFYCSNILNPTVVGRMDFPNFLPGTGYVPALSYPMSKAPWLTLKPRIMIMNSEPVNEARTEANRIFDAVQSQIEGTYGKDGPVVVRFKPATKIDDIFAELDDFKPDILHIHLHGSDDRTLGLENERGAVDKLPVDNFVARLQNAKFEPTLIVLTSCYSAAFAESLCGLAECVVAMQGKAEIAHALKFTNEFYGSLARGNDLGCALAQGKLGAMTHTIEHHIVDDVDPADIILLPGRAK
jgi:hypothetical protein